MVIYTETFSQALMWVLTTVGGVCLQLWSVHCIVMDEWILNMHECNIYNSLSLIQVYKITIYFEWCLSILLISTLKTFIKFLNRCSVVPHSFIFLHLSAVPFSFSFIELTWQLQQSHVTVIRDLVMMISWRITKCSQLISQVSN
jgi:hypothetical protein